MRRLVLVALALVLIPAPDALAQEETRVEAAAGIGGFVDPTQPVEITVRVTSDVLFTGVLQAASPAGVVRTPIEVPAGSEKVYTVVAPPPGNESHIGVRLLPPDGDQPVATAQVATRVADDELVVGVAAPDRVVAALGAIRSPVGGLPVIPVPINDPDRDLHPLRYLVLDRGIEGGDELAEWVGRGGRVVAATPESVPPSLQLRELGPFPSTGGEWFAAGDGEVLIVEDLDDVEAWQAFLRPVPLQLAPRDAWASPERPLGNAAANSGDQRIPSIPWLLAAILGYGLMVGPVNFFVLRRTGRRDLAWVTVPAISLVAVVVFWSAGQGRLQASQMNHATVVYSTSQGVTARSSIVLASGRPGEYRLGFGEEWVAYPVAIGEAGDARLGAPALAVDAEVELGVITYRLPQLGFAGAHALHQSGPVPRVEVTGTGAATELRVTNTTDVEFWAWGVGGPGRIRVAPEPLQPGETATLAAADRGRFEPHGNVGEAVMQSRRLWDDERGWRQLFPLAEAAGMMLEHGGGLYFFGYTDQHLLPLRLDEEPRQVEGATLVMAQLPAQATVGADEGSLPAELVAVGETAWLERGPGFVFVSTDRMTVRFRLPSALAVDPELRFEGGFGERPGSVEAWDWEAEAFQPVELNATLDRDRFAAANGEVLVRANAGGQGGEFAEAPMAPASLRLQWGT